MIETIVLPPPQAPTVADLDPSLDLRAGIIRLKRERQAVILAHYYQDGVIQDLADYVGDSLDLSRRAVDSRAEVIVFCGVRFMAEVAKILNPGRVVLLPDAAAGCSLEEDCPADDFRRFRQSHPEHQAVTYINCSAEVKGLSDVIVTSANAEHIVRQLPSDRPILFAPDRNLGAYVSRRIGRELTLWPGRCLVHESFSAPALQSLKQEHPAAPVLAHPECPPALLELADHIGSTASLLRFAQETTASEVIVVTEPHLIHQMRRLAPGKRFLAAGDGRSGPEEGVVCPHMALNTLAKLYLCLANLAPRVEMPPEMIELARRPLERMLSLSPPAKPRT